MKEYDTRIPREIIEKLKIFDDYEFFKEEHYYTYKNIRVGKSVTRLIEDYANEFERDKMAELVANKRGISVYDVLQEWQNKNALACFKGSMCHEFFQSLWSKEKFELEQIPFGIDKQLFIDKYNKINKQSEQFYNDYKDKLILIKDELLVGIPEFDIASAIDLLYYDIETQEVVLADIKTNEVLKGYNDDNKYKPKKMLVPLQDIDDTTINHYKIQLSIYRYFLEEYAGIKVGDMFIVYVSESIENYEVIPIEYLKNEVIQILETRRIKNMNSVPVLLMGASGTGKTRSLKNLPAKETAIINVTNKPLPFRNNGLKVVSSTDYMQIIEAIKSTDKKIIVIDDCGYLLTFENFEKATNKGYDKFTIMAQNFYKLIETVRHLDNEKIVYIITHEEVDDDNKTKPKMIGKMLNQQLCVEGLFTIVLRSVYKNGQYLFETKTDGVTVTKTPEDMFTENEIPNDLAEVDRIIRDYYGFKPIVESEEN